MSKKSDNYEHDFSSIFDGVGLPKLIRNEAFFHDFAKTSILWKLAKTIEKPMVFIDFSRSELLEMHPKSMQKRSRKKYRKKTAQKSIFDGFWPPKTS